jgi:hypothetical protein
VALAAISSLPGVTWLGFPPWWADPLQMYCLILAVAGLVCAGVHAFVPSRRTPWWPTALVLLAVPVVMTQVSAYGQAVLSSGAPALTLVPVVGVLLTSLLLIVPAVRGFRDLRQTTDPGPVLPAPGAAPPE